MLLLTSIHSFSSFFCASTISSLFLTYYRHIEKALITVYDTMRQCHQATPNSLTVDTVIPIIGCFGSATLTKRLILVCTHPIL